MLKRGLVVLHESLREQAAREPYRIYEQLDLGPGGYALAPARKAKQGIRELLQRRRAQR